MDCLVTKLKGNVSDDSLLKLGEFRIKVYRVENPTVKTQGMSLEFLEDTEIEIIGDGYFTDEGLTTNLGTNKKCNANEITSFYLSNGDYEISVLNKYKVETIYLYYVGNSGVTQTQMSHYEFNIDDLKYSPNIIRINAMSNLITGDLKSLGNMIKAEVILMQTASLTGDIANLKNLKDCITCRLNLMYDIYGDISVFSNMPKLKELYLSSDKIYGDVSVVEKLPNLESISLEGTSVSGNLSSFSNLSKITNLRIMNCTGDLSSIHNLSKLSFISLKRGTITGDLAKIPNVCNFISLRDNTGSTLTWSTRPSTANIIAIEGSPKIDNIDKMLQDQAQCVKAIPASGESYYKTITATGTRTSASDAAVSTLQEKGYTVSISNE